MISLTFLCTILGVWHHHVPAAFAYAALGMFVVEGLTWGIVLTLPKLYEEH